MYTLHTWYNNTVIYITTQVGRIIRKRWQTIYHSKNIIVILTSGLFEFQMCQHITCMDTELITILQRELFKNGFCILDQECEKKINSVSMRVMYLRISNSNNPLVNTPIHYEGQGLLIIFYLSNLHSII